MSNINYLKRVKNISYLDMLYKVVNIHHRRILYRIILNLYIDLTMNFLQNLLILRLLDSDGHRFQQNIL